MRGMSPSPFENAKPSFTKEKGGASEGCRSENPGPFGDVTASGCEVFKEVIFRNQAWPEENDKKGWPYPRERNAKQNTTNTKRLPNISFDFGPNHKLKAQTHRKVQYKMYKSGTQVKKVQYSKYDPQSSKLLKGERFATMKEQASKGTEIKFR